MAIDAAQALNSCVCLHAVCQDGNALGVASAAALELDVEYVAVDEIKADLGSANALGLVGIMLIHDNMFLSRFFLYHSINQQNCNPAKLRVLLCIFPFLCYDRRIRRDAYEIAL